MKIRAVKLLKDRFLVRWETTTPDGKTANHEIPDGGDPDPQLRDAIEQLHPDIVRVLEFPAGYAKSFVVTGLNVSEDDNGRVVVFTGKKELRSGRTIGLATPKLYESPDGTEQSGSSFMSEALNDKVTRVLAGARSYIDKRSREQTDIETDA